MGGMDANGMDANGMMGQHGYHIEHVVRECELSFPHFQRHLYDVDSAYDGNPYETLRGALRRRTGSFR